MFQNVNISKTGMFVIGALAGVALVAIVKSQTFKKGCAKLISAGIRLKDEASAFVEQVKEDAEDIVAEAKQQNAE